MEVVREKHHPTPPKKDKAKTEHLKIHRGAGGGGNSHGGGSSHSRPKIQVRPDSRPKSVADAQAAAQPRTHSELSHAKNHGKAQSRTETEEHPTNVHPHPRAQGHAVPHKAKARTGEAKVHHKKRLHAGHQQTVTRIRWGLGIFLGLLLIVGGYLAWQRSQQQKSVGQQNDQESQLGPFVQTTKVLAAPRERQLTLVGEAHPYVEATLYAKVSGYLQDLLVDEGSVVKKDQILGHIFSPETDQAYVAAKANAVNKTKISQRQQSLLRQNLISRQEAEVSLADAQVAQANLRTQEQMREYEILRAPFDGVVTSRFVDPGDLISNSSTTKSSSAAIVTVSDIHRLKVDAYVDQKYAPMIQPGMAVEMSLNERGDQSFSGEIARVSGALERATRMLLVEVDFDNSEAQVVAGSFMQVRLTLPSEAAYVIPVEAMVSLNGKPAVATIQDKNKLKFVPIEITENDGVNLLISKGLQVGEVLALNVGATLQDGSPVRAIVADAKAEPGKGEVLKAGAGEQPAPAGPAAAGTTGENAATANGAAALSAQPSGQTPAPQNPAAAAAAPAAANKTPPAATRVTGPQTGAPGKGNDSPATPMMSTHGVGDESGAPLGAAPSQKMDSSGSSPAGEDPGPSASESK